jgi:uncharacterized protein (DUF1697 family)
VAGGLGKGRDGQECPAARLAARIEKRLQDWLRFPVAVMVRTMEELEATVASDPFARGERGGQDKLYVAFLAKEPVREARFPIASEKEGLDAFAREGLNVFVISRPVAGGRSRFPNLLIEKELGVVATSRNWNTLERIVASVRKTRAPSAS